MRILSLLIICCLSFLQCKDKTQETIENAVSQNGAIKGPEPKNPDDLVIPSSCDMISPEDVKNILGVPAGAVNVKLADSPDDKSTRSCFFQWDDPSTANAGILLMIQTNPVFEDAPDYFTRSLQSKLTVGEEVLGHDKPMKYKEFDAGGKGAYSFDQSRFYWAKGNDYMFMLAFNISTLSEKEMVKAAEKFASKINANFDARK
jgi:hypothetical protein